jgi:transposase
MAVSKEKRWIIIGMHKKRMNNSEIGRLLKIKRDTVASIVKLYKMTGGVNSIKQTGRPRSLSAREERILLRTAIAQPLTDAVFLAKEMTKQLKRPISARIVRLALVRNGFHARKPAKKPLLTPAQRKRRLAFAKEYIQKPATFWRSTIFSDEAPFKIFCTPSGQWTWRRPHERLDVRHVIPTVKHGGGTLNLWACITYHGVGWMCFLPEGLDADTYLEILEDELEQTIGEYFPNRSGICFQQDGASVHRSRKVEKWFQKKKLPKLDWPAQSPDLNPIENLWADLKKRVYAKGKDITSKEALKVAIEEEWERTPILLLQKLIDSMPDRLQAVIRARGGPTKY